jgi:glycosyltransferase involved in cell wall biosynthesis
MRILQIHPFLKSEALSPAAGGMARVALQLTRLLVEAGHEVEVLPIPEGLGSRELWGIAPGTTVDVAAAMHIPAPRDLPKLPRELLRLSPRPRNPRAAFYDACALTALRREVAAFRPDIIHNHLARRPFPRLARALGLHGNLVLTHHHGEMGDDILGYDRILFPSQAAMAGITAKSGYSEKRARCVYSPVAPVFSRERSEPGRAREGIVFVGAVRVRKGIDLLLDAYRLRRELWAEPLTICGSGEDQALVDAAAAEGLPVRALGQVTPDETADRVAGAKLMVVPSRLEGFSVAISEALCSGTPVVGWAPQIRELQTLFNLPVGVPFDGRTQSAADLADAIGAALTDPGMDPLQRGRLARAAQQEFSEQKFLERTLQAYAELAPRNTDR